MTLLMSQNRGHATAQRITVERFTTPYIWTDSRRSIGRLSSGRLVATASQADAWAYSDDHGATWSIKTGVSGVNVTYLVPGVLPLGGFCSSSDNGIVLWNNDLQLVTRNPSYGSYYWCYCNTYQYPDGRIFWGALSTSTNPYSRVFSSNFSTVLAQIQGLNGGTTGASTCGESLILNPLDGYLYAGGDESNGSGVSDRWIYKVNISVFPPTIQRFQVGAASGTNARFRSMQVNPATGTMFAWRAGSTAAAALNFRTTNGFQTFTTLSASGTSYVAYVNVWKKWIRWNNGWLEWSADDGLTFEPFLEIANPFGGFYFASFAEIPNGIVFAQPGGALRITLS